MQSAVSEVVRVAKPGASVVLVQPVWKAPVDAVRREILSQHLGCRPLMVVEWKRLLRDAGVEGLHTEDWSDEETAFRPQITKPFPDFSELFTFTEKLGILRRARARWGWVAVAKALARVREVHSLLTQERVLGLDLVMGIKRVETAPEGAPAEPARDVEAPVEQVLEVEAPAEPARDIEAPAEQAEVEELTEQAEVEAPTESAPGEETGQVTGLPLFGEKGEGKG